VHHVGDDVGLLRIEIEAARQHLLGVAK